MFHVAFCSDSNYVELLKVAVFSLLKTNENVKVHILKIDQFDSSEIDEICNSFGVLVSYYDLNIDLPSKGRFSKAMFGRFYIPELIEEDVILYLDCDVVIYDKLDELFLLNERNSSLLVAVEEDDSPIITTMKNRLKVQKYFNSGVIIINNNERTKERFYQCISFIKSNNAWLTYPDQDAINAVFENEILSVDIKYNYFRNYKCEAKPVILHYAHEKPWVPFSDNFYSKVYDEFIESGNSFYLRKFEINVSFFKFSTLLIKRVLKKIGLMNLLQRLIWK
ncbi:TPA: glycosyltransferase family 8 protein [Vibrio parahaemolyticus]